jgi:hypothetical protein
VGESLWFKVRFLARGERLSSSQEKLSSLDYVRDYNSINLPNKNSKLQEILNRLGNELEAIRFVSKQAWGSIAERFLGKVPKQHEIRISQESMSKHIRAKEVLKEQNVENNKLYKKENQQGHAIKSASPPTSRTFESEAHGIRVRPSAEREEFKKPLSSYEVVQEPQALTSDNLTAQLQQQFEEENPEYIAKLRAEMLANLITAQQAEGKESGIRNTIDRWQQEFEKTIPVFTAKLKAEIKAETEAYHLKTQDKHETRPELTLVERIDSFIKTHKLARTEAERTQAATHLRKYAQELYKQDPTLKSIRDKDKEMTKKIRAILFEENKGKQFDKSYER